MFDVIFVTNMFPSKQNPSYGAFCKTIHDIISEKYVVKKLTITYSSNTILKVIKYFLINVKIIFYVIFYSKAVFYFHYPSHTFLIMKFLPLKRNIISNFHGSEILNEGVLKEAYISALFKSNLVIVPSQSYLTTLKSKISNYDYINFEIIPTAGIPDHFFSIPSSNKFTHTIGFVGRTTRMKGIDTVFKTYSEFKKKTEQPIKLLVVGEEVEIESFINYGGKEEDYKDIVFTGPIQRDHLAEYYNQMDCILFPSRYKESLGLVVLEAMSTGTQVFMNYQDSISDLLNGSEAVEMIEDNYEKYVKSLKKFYSKSLDLKSKENSTLTVFNFRESNIKFRYFEAISKIISLEYEQ